jgi:hypothetical protein
VEVRARRPDSSPEKAGHRRGFIAIEVLPGSVSVWLLVKEPTDTFGKSSPHLREHWSLSELEPEIGGGPNDRSLLVAGTRYEAARPPDSPEQPVTRRCSGEQRIAVGCVAKLEPKRKHMRAGKGTREARSRRAIARIGRSSDRPNPRR